MKALRRMSILFRTKEWLTVAQLARAWSFELGRDQPAEQIERNLVHALFEDIVNGRLDDLGPPVQGRRLGLRLITPECRAGFIVGADIRDLIAGGDISRLSHRIVVMKEAALDFARRRDLTVPSWWTVEWSKLQNSGLGESCAESVFSSSDSAISKRRGRLPKKRNLTKAAMKKDVQDGRLTSMELTNMLEKELSFRYGVGRETARQARQAVLAEMSESSIPTLATNDK
jgi:hypothetical protein